MSIYNDDNDLDTKAIPVFGLIVLLACLIIVNYLSIKAGADSGGVPFIAFVACVGLLLFINPVYVFVFCFVMHVNVMSCFPYLWAKFLTLVCMFTVFLKDSKSLNILFNDKKLKVLVFLSIVFSLYLLLINIGFKSELSFKIFLGNCGYILGFLTIIPAYFCTLRQPKKLFLSLVVVAASFLFVYYFSLIYELNLFKLENYERGTGAGVDRLAGYDTRQFIIFFAYLIPAVAVSKLKNISKYLLVAIGILSYVILILAFYRLVMFYVAVGAIVSYFFIRKHVEKSNILKYFFGFLILIFTTNIFFAEYFAEIKNLFLGTLDYFSGTGTDSSADARFDFQFPILTKLFFANMWTGIGLVEIKALQEFDMMGFVDMPLMGTLTAFGIIGMFIYYLKFFVLLSGMQTNLYHLNDSKFDPFIFFVYSTLKAYFIIMITFRFFYISWELTFDYQQAEFGLFAGAFLAIHQHIKSAENACEEDG